MLCTGGREPPLRIVRGENMVAEHIQPEDGAAEGYELDPDMKIVLARMLERMATRPPMGTSTPAEMRARFADDIVAWNVDPPALPLVENRVASTRDRAVPVRFYDPIGDGDPLPTLIYFHGGGWVVGDLDSNDRALRLLALESGVGILSVDYCLAPENPFPAPLNECLEVARWVYRNGASHGIDVERLAIGGDSAGANLALATAIDLREAGEQWLRYMLLIYGVYAREHDTCFTSIVWERPVRVRHRCHGRAVVHVPGSRRQCRGSACCSLACSPRPTAAGLRCRRSTRSTQGRQPSSRGAAGSGRAATSTSWNAQV